MPLIAIILLAFTVMLIGIRQDQLMDQQAQGTALQQMTAQSAKEFSEFTNAAAEYVQSTGLPLPGTALTVSNLQSANLLPSDFPTQTPFGQTLVADYVTDSNNPAVLDVVVHTTGAMNAASLQRAGVTQDSVAAVQYDTAVIAQNQVPSTIAGSTGQFFGVASGSTLNNLGSSNSMTLPSGISTQQPEVTEYILSPGQYGYWLIGTNVYGFSSGYELVFEWDASDNEATIFYNTYIYPAIYSQGFSLTCPTNAATNLSNLANGSPIGSNETNYNSYNNNATQSPFFCIPAYKGQVHPFSASAQTQTISPEMSTDTIYWNNQYYTNPTSIFNWASNTTYVNPSNIVGLNNNLYATGGFMLIYPPEPQYPSNEASPQPMPNAITGIGISISVKTPQNTTDTYQIELDGGSLYTGSGCPTSLINPFTQEVNVYNVWANGQGSENQNLCGSQETFWTDWHAVKNSSNSSSIPVSQNYESGGNSYTLNFSVATPMVN